MTHHWHKINWDVRYPANYKVLVAIAHRSTRNICCCCLVAPSVQVHHSRYLGKSDRPGINLFPLCLQCHKISHTPTNWVKHKGNPLWKSRNTEQWELKLRAGYKKLFRQI